MVNIENHDSGVSPGHFKQTPKQVENTNAALAELAQKGEIADLSPTLTRMRDLGYRATNDQVSPGEMKDLNNLLHTLHERFGIKGATAVLERTLFAEQSKTRSNHRH